MQGLSPQTFSGQGDEREVGVAAEAAIKCDHRQSTALLPAAKGARRKGLGSWGGSTGVPEIPEATDRQDAVAAAPVLSNLRKHRTRWYGVSTRRASCKRLKV